MSEESIKPTPTKDISFYPEINYNYSQLIV